MTASNPCTILVVEDNDDHAELILRTFEAQNANACIRRLRDGEAALSYLHARGPYADREQHPAPDIVLLDLRLPKVDGLEVLRQIKESPELRPLPVVVLTTSEAEIDVARAYDHHANAYLVKPLGFVAFNDLLKDLGMFWLVWNKSSRPEVGP
jgi:CheY-like chemotaxis protein